MPSNKSTPDPGSGPAPGQPSSPAPGRASGPAPGAGSGADVPELIWLRPERAGRGPRPAHSRASIARAALALADAEGLEAVTMRRIAGELGAGTMSLYNYVPKKEQLLDLMLDAVCAEYQLPAAPSGDWRADLRLLAGQQLEILRRHPWAVTIMRTRASFGPNSLRYTEFFLGALAGAELSGGRKMEALAMLNGYLCQFVEWERATLIAVRDPQQWQRDLVSYLTGVASSGDYPNIAAALSSGNAPMDPQASFERFLEKLLTVLVEP
ncbi:TetR/AcrR family transcriptional regulator [Kitasatospora sp. NBC_01287]|uniref:TetR/AcrR family transcriptional regulator n=1 Tax=Kitasatospora sp. NBC_01287 TaxID=2903573 RepID=UPI0022531648|nr:TetR/AcrR family transcriptional regulator C-terminal domain-containing protein [Kitasatospora sp. NBC_01287]MCX4745067.1 TetR/AcrR family transcriptional regulator [Kitasatospora sp. NBC_01287]